MTSSVSKDEAIIVEQGIAPVLWAIHTLQARRWPTDRKTVLEMVSTIEQVPESAVVEGHLLLERLEYENQRQFNSILLDLQVDSYEVLKAFGHLLGLAAARVIDYSPSLGALKVPYLDVTDCYFLDDLCEPLEASMVRELHRSVRRG